MYKLDNLCDEQLLHQLHCLVKTSRQTTAQILAHIAEVDRRKLHCGKACPSMFAYCVEVLGLSEAAAYKRIGAARAARKYPVIFEMVADGRLHLSAIKCLIPHLQADNHAALLEAASHKSTREIERMLAERFPQPDVPASVRKLPAPRPSPTSEAPSLDAPRPPPASAGPQVVEASPPAPRPSEPEAPPPAAPPPRPPLIAPLAPERFKIQLTADQALHDKLRETQNLLRHQIPDGDIAKVLGRALALLVDDLKRKKVGQTSRPQAPKPRPPEQARTRHIPNHIKRAVWARDDGQCAFVDDDGRRCPARGWLEFHHRVPYARGGRHEEGNIELRCRSHNQHEARLEFGGCGGQMDRGSGSNWPRGQLPLGWPPHAPPPPSCTPFGASS